MRNTVLTLKLFLIIVLFFSYDVNGQTLDQNHSPNNASGGGFLLTNDGAQNVGQTFIAGQTGEFSEFHFSLGNYLDALVAGDFQLNLYAGDGYGGALLATKTFQINSAPPNDGSYIEYTVNMPAGIPMIAGNTYTVDLRGITGTNALVFAPSGNSYPIGGFYLNNGQSFFYNNYDLWFKTYVTLPQPASALNYDGVDDYVYCGNSALLNVTGSLSVEAFINRSTLNTDDCIIGKDIYATNTGYSFWVYQNNKLIFRFGNIEFQSISSINQNTWTHVAATYDSGVVKLYINGVLDATYTGVAPPASNTNGLYLGTPQDAVGNSLFAFSGKMDEVRVWNRGLDQCEIQNNMNGELPSGQTGLLAYYQFNQGIDSQDNATITNLIDSSGNNYNGTLSNFTLNGPTSNWVNPGGVTTGSTSPAYSPLTVATLQTFLSPSTVANLTATGTNINWYNVPVGGIALVSTTTLTTGIYYVTQTTGTCESSRTAVQVNIIASALNFDGINDKVILGNTINSLLDITNTITVEAWVKPENATFNGVIIGNYYSNNNEMQFLLRRDFDHYSFWVDDETGFQPVNSGANTVVLNTWQHIAGVWDGSSLYIYIDGVLAGTSAGISGSSLASTSNDVVIGNNNYPEPFAGNIDEVRIWNRAVNACEIQNNMNGELSAGQTGLLAYYQFNQGIDSADNTAISTLTDSSGNNYTGSLTNFTLNGPSSNWVNPGAVITGVSSPTYALPNVNAVANQTLCANATTAPIIYSSTTTGTLCGQINETNTITLTAPTGYVFTSIPFASYGTPNGSCGNFTLGSCHATNSTSIVSGLALGQNSFNISASNGVFGDPCSFTGKRLYIEAVYNNTTFNWINNTPSIGLAASGSGNIPSFTAINTGSSPIVATITVTPSINGCSGVPIQYTITVNHTPNDPTGSSTQVINGGVATDATIEDIVINPSTVTWYASSSDALAGTNALPAGTQIFDGFTYYAVNYENGCSSAPFDVTVTVVLGTDTFDSTNFSAYPNPTSDVITLQYSKEITEISVLNLLGQTMLNKKLNATETTIDLSNLPSATYFVKVVSEEKIKMIKVIKR